MLLGKVKKTFAKCVITMKIEKDNFEKAFSELKWGRKEQLRAQMR